MSNKSRFKTDQGVYYTKALFFETAPFDLNVQYTLKQEDHRGYPSLRRLYLEECDPTEYAFANKHLGGWDHWTKLKEAEWFQPYLQNWREELEVKMKSEAFKQIISESRNSLSKNYLMANKYLVETLRRVQSGEDIGAKNTKGRPDKHTIDKKAYEIAQEHSKLNEDAERILTNKGTLN